MTSKLVKYGPWMSVMVGSTSPNDDPGNRQVVSSWDVMLTFDQETHPEESLYVLVFAWQTDRVFYWAQFFLHLCLHGTGFWNDQVSLMGPLLKTYHWSTKHHLGTPPTDSWGTNPLHVSYCMTTTLRPLNLLYYILWLTQMCWQMNPKFSCQRISSWLLHLLRWAHNTEAQSVAKSPIPHDFWNLSNCM